MFTIPPEKETEQHDAAGNPTMPAVRASATPGESVHLASKEKLLRGVIAKKRESFPPFMLVPCVFFALWIYIVSCTRHTSLRFQATGSINAQFIDVNTDNSQTPFTDVVTINDWWQWFRGVQVPAIVASNQAPAFSKLSNTAVLVVLAQKRDTCVKGRPRLPQQICRGFGGGISPVEGDGCLSGERRYFEAYVSRSSPSTGVPNAYVEGECICPYGAECSRVGRASLDSQCNSTAPANVVLINCPKGSSQWCDACRAEYSDNPGCDTWCTNRQSLGEVVLAQFKSPGAIRAAVMQLVRNKTATEGAQNNATAAMPEAFVNKMLSKFFHFSLDGNLSSAPLQNVTANDVAERCSFLCAYNARCGSWSVQRTSGALDNATQCTLFVNSALQAEPNSGEIVRRPPAFTRPRSDSNTTIECVSGQPKRFYTGFGTNWQCPHNSTSEPETLGPFYNAAPPGSVLDLNSITFPCTAHDTEFDSCVVLGDAFAQMASVEQAAGTLQSLQWIDVNTTEVMLQVYSFTRSKATGQPDSFAEVTHRFAIGYNGFPQRSSNVQAVLPIHEDLPSGFGVAIAAFVIYLVVIFYEALASFLKHRQARMLKRAPKFWWFIEFWIIASALSYLSLFWAKIGATGDLVRSFVGCNGIHAAHVDPFLLPFLPCVDVDNKAPAQFFADATSNGGFTARLSDMPLPMRATYIDRVRTADRAAQLYVNLDSFSQYTAVMTTYFLTFRLLRFLQLQPRLAIVTDTLHKAMDDLIHFAFIFMLVLIGFAAAAVFNFGGYIASVNNLGTSIYTMFYMSMGEYSDVYDAMAAQDPVGAKLFFLPFLFLVILILINVFLAIVVDSYGEVKDDLKNADAVPSFLDSSFEKGRRWQKGIMRMQERAAASGRVVFASRRKKPQASRARAPSDGEHIELQDIFDGTNVGVADPQSQGAHLMAAHPQAAPGGICAALFPKARVTWASMARALAEIEGDSVSAADVARVLNLQSEAKAQIQIAKFLREADAAQATDAHAQERRIDSNGQGGSENTATATVVGSRHQLHD